MQIKNIDLNYAKGCSYFKAKKHCTWAEKCFFENSSKAVQEFVFILKF